MKIGHSRTAARAMPQRYRSMLAALLLLSGAAFHASAAAPADSLSDTDKACLGCHGAEGLKKDLDNGQSLPLHVGADEFANSVHKPIGCTGCHSQVKIGVHPGDVKPIKGVREYAIAQAEICRGCHDRVYRTYQGSMHAVRIREGILAAPACADCHKPHQINPPSVQDGPKNACLACHTTTIATHEKWLPNAGRHLEAVACSACHAPDALKKVDLRLIDSATRQRLVAGGPDEFDKRMRSFDKNGDGLDAVELRALLASFNPGQEKVAFLGHIELRTGMEAHEMSAKVSAVRECMNCHHERAAPFQRVTVSMLGPDQRPMRYDAHNDVLRSVYTVDALSGFYAIGGTRIKAFDILLALALIGGISVPVLHLLVRRIMKRHTNKNGDHA